MPPWTTFVRTARSAFSCLRGGRKRLRYRFEVAVNNMSQGLCLYDADDRLELTNQRFSEIYRQPMGTLKPGLRFRDMLAASLALGNYPGRTLEEVYGARKAFIDRREPGTFLQELGDGRLIAISHQPLADGGWVATYEDITERRRAEEQITFLALHDALTLLPNRRKFADLLALAIARAATVPTSLLFLDLDGFKRVNDALGHAAGDMLLRQVAERLKLEVREGDVVARFGGDEFALLLPGVIGEEALAMAERIIAAVSQPYPVGPERVAQVGVSIGIAWAPDHADGGDMLMSHADEALYAAKRTARGTARIYIPGSGAEASAPTADLPRIAAPRGAVPGRARAAALRLALERGELHLHH